MGILTQGILIAALSSSAWLIVLVPIHDLYWIAKIVCVGGIVLGSVDSVDDVVSKRKQM